MLVLGTMLYVSLHQENRKMVQIFGSTFEQKHHKHNALLILSSNLLICWQGPGKVFNKYNIFADFYYSEKLFGPNGIESNNINQNNQAYNTQMSA